MAFQYWVSGQTRRLSWVKSGLRGICLKIGSAAPQQWCRSLEYSTFMFECHLCLSACEVPAPQVKGTRNMCSTHRCWYSWHKCVGKQYGHCCRNFVDPVGITYASWLLVRKHAVVVTQMTTHTTSKPCSMPAHYQNSFWILRSGVILRSEGLARRLSHWLCYNVIWTLHLCLELALALALTLSITHCLVLHQVLFVDRRV